MLEPRGMMFVEDHVNHVSSLLKAIRKVGPGSLEELTVLCLDRPRSGTEKAVQAWLEIPTLQVATRVPPERVEPNHRQRLYTLSRDEIGKERSYCSLVAGSLRPKGLLVHDIQMDFGFFKGKKDWHTIEVAARIRGYFGVEMPEVWFVTNKPSPFPTMRKKLSERNFNLRQVYNKGTPEHFESLARLMVDYHNRMSILRWESDRNLIVALSVRQGEVSHLEYTRNQVSSQVEPHVDLLFWPEQDGILSLTGRILRHEVRLGRSSRNARILMLLAQARFDGSEGVPVNQIAELGAPIERLPMREDAHRFVWKIKRRLGQNDLVVNIEGRYRLRDSLKVAQIMNE